MTVRTATLNGVRYDVDLCGPIYGVCDPPYGGRPGIRVTAEPRTKNELIVLIHECLHGCSWLASEERVDQISKDIGRLLWRLGYRRP